MLQRLAFSTPVKRKCSCSVHGKVVQHVSDFMKQCRFLHTHLRHMVNRSFFKLYKVLKMSNYIWLIKFIFAGYSTCVTRSRKKKSEIHVKTKLLNDIWLLQKVYIVSVLQLKTQSFYELVALQKHLTSIFRSLT